MNFYDKIDGQEKRRRIWISFRNQDTFIMFYRSSEIIFRGDINFYALSFPVSAADKRFNYYLYDEYFLPGMSDIFRNIKVEI